MRAPVILRIFKDSQLVEVRQFDLDQIVLGQNADVQLDLPAEGVSPIHCLIELRDAGYYLCDLGSQNGTFKNGQAVLDDSLSSGDELQVGPYKIIFYVGVPKPKVAPKLTEDVVDAVPPVPATPATTPAPVAPPAPSVAVPPVSVAKIEPVTPAKITPPALENTSPTAESAAANEAKAPVKQQNEEARPTAIPAVKPPPAPTNVTAKKSGVRPEIKTGIMSLTGAAHLSAQTFAPPSDVADLRDVLKPAKGNVVEVIVAWKERIIDTFHFRTKGNYRIGAAPTDPIRVSSASIPKNWNFLEIAGTVRVNLSDAMECELVTSTQGRRTLEECLTAGKAQRTGTGTAVRLDQNEMICVSLGGGTLNVFIRYAPQAPMVPMTGSLGFSGAEASGLIMAVVLTSLLAFYISATTPKNLYDKPEEDPTRVAQIIFNAPPPKPPPPPPPPPPEQKPPAPPPEPVKPPPPPPKPEKAVAADKQHEAQKKGPQTENKVAQRAEKAGQASEVAPIPNSQNKPKKFTSVVKQGGATKTSDTASANAKSKDVTKVGLFSAFGGGGMRQKLDQAYSGSGEVLGNADKATGTSGFNENRAGDDLGSKFKDTGAGGKGTATQGIAGIGTKGRGSGQAAYGAMDGMGAKSTVAVEAGGAEEDFVGTIDKEAVRRRVRHYLNEIRGCYNRELNRLEKGQRLEGKVVISWEIIAKGVAQNVKVKSTTLNNSNVENCIRERLASWSFPEPPVGMTAEVSFPFYLRPEN